MSDRHHIGDRIDFETDIDNYFALTFLPLDFFDNWERGSLLSDFAADYFRHNFPNDSEHNLISTVLNELVENAVKFSKNNSQPVQVVLKKRNNLLLIQSSNTIPRHRQERFQKLCKELFLGDLNELYVRKLDENLAQELSSGIGLILIKKDYCKALSFDFFRDDNNNAKVEVTAELDFTI